MLETIERTASSRSNREIAAEAVAQLVGRPPRHVEDHGGLSDLADLEDLAVAGGADAHVHCSGPDRHVGGVRGARPADRGLFAAFSEPRLSVERVEEVGDRVISHVSFSGRHTESYRGVPASGREMRAHGVIVHDLSAGQIRDAWSVLHWR